MPTIKKIRKLIKSQENGLNSSKSSEDDDISVKTDDEKPVSEEDILESLGLKHVARTPDGKIDHAKLSMKDRMAIVRGMLKLNSLTHKIDVQYFAQLFTILTFCRNVSYSAGLVFFTTELHLRVRSYELRF